jgi:hypothetical protein
MTVVSTLCKMEKQMTNAKVIPASEVEEGDVILVHSFRQIHRCYQLDKSSTFFFLDSAVPFSCDPSDLVTVKQPELDSKTEKPFRESLTAVNPWEEFGPTLQPGKVIGSFPVKQPELDIDIAVKRWAANKLDIPLGEIGKLEFAGDEYEQIFVWHNKFPSSLMLREEICISGYTVYDFIKEVLES